MSNNQQQPEGNPPDLTLNLQAMRNRPKARPHHQQPTDPGQIYQFTAELRGPPIAVPHVNITMTAAGTSKRDNPLGGKSLEKKEPSFNVNEALDETFSNSKRMRMDESEPAGPPKPEDDDGDLYDVD